MNYDKATITSLIVAILLPLMSILGIGELTQSYILALASGIIALVVWYYNEKHNSDLVSGTCQCDCETFDEVAKEGKFLSISGGYPIEDMIRFIKGFSCLLAECA